MEGETMGAGWHVCFLLPMENGRLMIHKGSNKNSLNIGNFRWNAKHERIVMSCQVSLVWFFGLYSSYISETIEDQSFAMGKAMERVRFLFLNAAFHAAFLCVCLAFGSKHLQCFFPCTLVQLTPLMKQDLAAWLDGVRGDLQHVTILSDAQICGLTQLIYDKYNDVWTFPSDNQSGVILVPCYQFWNRGEAHQMHRRRHLLGKC